MKKRKKRMKKKKKLQRNNKVKAPQLTLEKNGRKIRNKETPKEKDRCKKTNLQPEMKIKIYRVL
jgi:hypothetical protein